MKVYNTLTGEKEELKTRERNKVAMYVCGPTVYNYIHIGNARAYIAFDVIHRYLEYKGFDVNYVRNLTDVDDKIINRAKEENLTPEEVAKKYTKAFHDDMEILGVKPPEIEPMATNTISQMIKMIEGLIEKGFAYVVDGDVFYRVTAFKDYGKLSKRTLEEMQAGARIEVDKRKEHPMDFALWKKAKEEEPAWDSPWSKGRPGWHIECSAMSLEHLGSGFDIHGGGQDLIFPHHENEIAQSEGYTGKQFVNYWLHNGFVNVEKEKMAKSLGNVILIKDLEKKYKGDLDGLRNDLRMLFLTTNYHGPINFSFAKLDEAKTIVERIEYTLQRINYFIERAPEELMDEPLTLDIDSFKDAFFDDMDDDFNTPKAISRVFDFINEINLALDRKRSLTIEEKELLKLSIETVLDLTSVLGFNLEPGRRYDNKKVTDISKEMGIYEPRVEAHNLVLRLLDLRERARKDKDYDKADLIRKKLKEAQVNVEDTPFGPFPSPSPSPFEED